MKALVALVTGGSGFVGTHLVGALLDAGWEVLSLDVAPPPMTVRADVKAVWSESNLLSREVARAVVSVWPKIDVIFHLAAAPWNASQDDEFVRTNTFGTLRALEMARGTGAALVLASSQLVYGVARHTPFYDYDGLRPYSPYGYSKWLAEQLVEHFALHYGVRATALRFGNIYGPGQERSRQLIPDVLRKMDAMGPDRTIVLKGTGRETRDWLYIDDAIAAYLAVAKRTMPGFISYNVGTGVATTVWMIASCLYGLYTRGASYAREIEEKGGNYNEFIRFSGKVGPHDPEQLPIALDATRLRSIGWEPKVDLNEGLRRTVEAWKATPLEARKPLV